MMGMAAYESYKDSGEGWIEDVPAHWEIRKLKHLFQEKKHRQNLDLNCGSISFGEVVEKDDERVPLATKASYQEVSKGEFLVNPLNLNYDLKSLRIGLSDIDVVVSAGYLVLQAKDDTDKRYFKYLLHRYDVAYMKLLGSGVRQTISFNHIANSILVAPPLPEQRAIAAFLDDKCAKIEGAVKIKEDQIALLRERRQIIIQNAVTRGLNPAAPMKDSGIDWIGQIPAQWDVMRLKHISKIRYGLGQPPKESDDGLPLLRATNVERGKINPANLIRVDPADVPTGRDAFLKAGEIIVVRSGAYTGDSAIVPSEYGGSVAGYDMVVTASGVDCHFLALALLTPYVLFEQLYLLRMRAAQPHLNKEELSETVILVPPPQEQHLIAERMRIESNKIEDGIAIKEAQIAALKEYKTSLINAAVTGKIKVI